MRNDFVSIPHQTLFKLCARIHSSICVKEKILDDVSAAEMKGDRFSFNGSAEAIRHDIRNLKDILGRALDCAPDDIKDFFTHYDEIRAKCPF